MAHYRFGKVANPEEIKALIASTDRCSICSQQTELVTDHCHATMTLRGRLCQKCNVGLGHFEDDPGLLTAAITYLQQHQRKLER
jgi:hypothetical protein